jgi:trimeric autotransporter adhesin
MKRTLPGTIFWVLEKYTSCFVVLIALLFISSIATAQTVTTGKSYINITRPNGGTFLPGDVLEVRATIAVVGGNSTNRVNSIRYNDTINLAKFTYIAGSLRMLSNEGKPQVPGLGIPAYTDLSDGDSANIDIPTGRIRFNIGNGAGSCNVTTQGTSITNAGALWGALRPTFFGGTCIRMYVYRVTINNVPTQVDIDSVIRLSAGNFRYRIGSSTTDQLSNFAPYMIKIVPDYGLCTMYQLYWIQCPRW